MKWLKRKVIKWVEDDWNYRNDKRDRLEYGDANVKNSGISPIPSRKVPDSVPSLSFRIYSAQNGDVLEFTKFDERTHQHDVTVYIVSKETNMGEFVSKCMSLELLK
jgi:hypothetical protein